MGAATQSDHRAISKNIAVKNVESGNAPPPTGDEYRDRKGAYQIDKYKGSLKYERWSEMRRRRRIKGLLKTGDNNLESPDVRRFYTMSRKKQGD